MSASRRPALLALTLTLAAATAVTGVSGCGSPWGGSEADATPPTGTITPRPTVPSRPPAPGVQVSGNRFVDLQGRTVRLTGFNHSGAEYACIEGPEIFDTPDGTALGAQVVTAMRSWRGANVVRLALNEQCWLGIGGRARVSGAPYRAAVADAVARLNAAGFVVVLDLHRSAPGRASPAKQEPMPDRDHSVRFWSQVAATYRGNLAVMFDLFNEPFPDGGSDTEAWACWRDGGCSQRSQNGAGDYAAAGMNELITAVRATGARNVVLAGGLNYSESLSRWMQYKPSDPTGNLAAAVHVYSFNDCSTVSCYDGDMASVAAQVPLFVGEFGPDLTITKGYDSRCPRSAIGASGFSAALIDWMDARGVSYAAWTFNARNDCWALIEDWVGTPSPVWGALVEQRLAASAAP